MALLRTRRQFLAVRCKPLARLSSAGRTPRRPTAASLAYFAGLIDEVRIYNRALSISEIEYLYAHPTDKRAASESPPPTGAGSPAVSRSPSPTGKSPLRVPAQEQEARLFHRVDPVYPAAAASLRPAEPYV